MPRYSYKCSCCENVATVRHGINDSKVDCASCKSKGTLKRLPSRFTLVTEETSSEVGSIVKRSIEELKEDLDRDKEKLKSELFDPDE
jgi:putative FmdB family regulatory protein